MADASNPFSDPAVSNAASGDSGGGNSGAYGDSAYDEQQMTQAASTAGTVYSNMSDEQKKQAQGVAINVAQHQMQSQTQSAYDEAQKDMNAQKDQNAAPEAPGFIKQCYAWFPLRWFVFFAGVLLVVAPIIDMAFQLQKISFTDAIVYLYLILFGVIICFAEAPSLAVTRRIQLTIFFYARLMSRMWGRVYVYMFVSIISMAQFENDVTFTAFVGVYLFVLLVIMIFVSRLSAVKYQRIFEFVAAGKEGEERKQFFAAKFDELDLDSDGFIGSDAIVKVAREAGRELANCERATIQTFLDESCNGPVSKEDWIHIFDVYNLNQRFL